MQADAYRAGMKPAEFFDLTPFEVVEWIPHALEGQFGIGWRMEAIRRMKKLPGHPSELWKTKKSFMTPAEMLRTMKKAVEEQNRGTQKVRAPNGKTMRDFRGKW